MCYFNGHIRELGSIPDALLNTVRQQLSGDTDLWEVEDARKPNKFACFENTAQHIIFQFPVDLQSHLESRYSPLWETWKESICPLIDKATSGYQYAHGRTARIMFAKLYAGCGIGLHVDQNPSADIPHKIHIPLVTRPEVEFYEDKSTYHLGEGFAYEVNNKIPHGGMNKSPVDRIHLIFDYYPVSK